MRRWRSAANSSRLPRSVPDYRVCEHMPLTARQAHRFAVVRSVHHDDPQHNNAGYATLTGTRPALLPNTVEALASPRPDDHPAFGAVLSRLRPSPAPWVALPYPVVNGVHYPGQTAGFLGARDEPLWLRPDPKASEFAFPELELPPGSSAARVRGREQLLEAVDRAVGGALDQAERWGRLRTCAPFRPAPSTWSRRPPRDVRCGSTGRTRGCATVTAATSSVRVACWRGGWSRPASRWSTFTRSVSTAIPGPLPLSWDTHWDNFKFLKEGILPIQDRGFAALLEDLAERGLLDETLVVWFGEFGRSPQVNQQAARALAGRLLGRLCRRRRPRRRQSMGASDKHGAYPVASPVTPQDIAATIYHCLGIDPETRLRDRLGRPVEIGSGGKVIAPILA